MIRFNLTQLNTRKFEYNVALDTFEEVKELKERIFWELTPN